MDLQTLHLKERKRKKNVLEKRGKRICITISFSI